MLVFCAPCSSVFRLQTQLEEFEADAEALASKATKKKPERLQDLERFMTRHKEHLAKLEQVLRLLENDQVTGSAYLNPS